MISIWCQLLLISGYLIGIKYAFVLTYFNIIMPVDNLLRKFKKKSIYGYIVNKIKKIMLLFLQPS